MTETYIDENGDENTRFVPDGTVTYYDLWPGGDGAGKKNYQQNLPAYYHEILESKELVFDNDITMSEGRPPQGVIRFTTTFETDITAMKKMIEAKNNNLHYNALSYNCSDYAKIGVNAVSEEEVSGQEMIQRRMVTTPNSLFKEASLSKNAEVIRDPGRQVNKRFIPGFLPVI